MFRPSAISFLCRYGPGLILGCWLTTRAVMLIPLPDPSLVDNSTFVATAIHADVKEAYQRGTSYLDKNTIVVRGLSPGVFVLSMLPCLAATSVRDYATSLVVGMLAIDLLILGLLWRFTPALVGQSDEQSQTHRFEPTIVTLAYIALTTPFMRALFLSLELVCAGLVAGLLLRRHRRQTALDKRSPAGAGDLVSTAVGDAMSTVLVLPLRQRHRRNRTAGQGARGGTGPVAQ